MFLINFLSLQTDINKADFGSILNEMQVSVTFPDSGLPTVSFTAGADSLVSDVLTAAAGEWDIDPEDVELTFAGDLLCETSGLLAVHGVGPNAELEVQKKRFRVFGKRWLIDKTMREKLLLRLEGSNYLHLDTPTFSKDGSLSFDGDLLPPMVKSIWFRNSNSEINIVTKKFLSNSSITDLNLSGLNAVTTIGDNFLSRCSSITALDLSGLNAVTAIGCEFLSDCSSITALSFSGLNTVTTIGVNFLSRCSSITALDLSGLNSVTTIGNYFLSRCSSITTLDLSGLNAVTTIGNYFLSRCSSITALDLSGLNSVTTIGNYFLSRCSSITTLDLPNTVTAIGNYFLSNCSSITTLDLSGLQAVTTVGYGFLLDCSSITALNLSGLSKSSRLSDVGLFFLNGCEGLE